MLAERAARERQSRRPPDQRTRDDKGRVESAGCGDDIAGQITIGTSRPKVLPPKKGKSPPRIARRAEQIADQSTVGGRPDMGAGSRDCAAIWMRSLAACRTGV